MEHVLSTHLFVNHRLTSISLEKIWDAGFPAVEIFCARQHLDYRDHAQITELGHWFRDSQLKLHSLHAPMYSDDVWGRSGPNAVITITEETKAKRLKMVEEIKRAIEVADLIPFTYLILHLGVADEAFDERKLDAALSSLEELRLFAHQRGVEILLENIPNDLSTAERLKYFLSVTHLDLHFCFDIGHAHLGAGVAYEFEIMKDRIRSTHIHDNDGKKDLHLFPAKNEGNIDWQAAMKLLGSRPEQYPLVLELREVPDLANPLEEASATIKKLEQLRN